MAKKIIDPKRPPLIWDTIDDAFGKINDNFTELYLTIGGGGSPVDLTNISSSITPSDSMIYDLGSPTNRWRRLYVGGGAIYVDNAAITATGTTLELPFGTKVGGVLIKDPTEGSFKNIIVSGQSNVIAENLKDTLTLVGAGINITTNAGTDTITFTNAGVTSAVSGSGISVNSSTGAVTITNTGVTGVSAGSGIGVSAGTGSVTISNTGVTQLIAGSNIVLSAATGSVTITNSSPNILQNLYRFISVSGQDTLDPISPNSTLSFAAGSNIQITTNALTNTVTFSSPNVQDIVGSIFADDSTLLVDGVNGIIPAEVVKGTFTGNVTGNVIGDVKGSVFADDSSLLVDSVGGILPAAKVSGTFVTISTDDKVRINGNTSTLQGDIFNTQSQINDTLGQISSLNGMLFAPPFGGNPIPGPNPSIQSQIGLLNSQLSSLYNILGTYSFYLSDPNGEISYNAETAEIRMDKTLSVPRILSFLTGDVKGSVFGDDSSILVDSVSGVLRGTLIGNVTGNVNGNVTGNVNGTVTGNVFTTLIDSADSSAITVVPPVVFNTQVNIEGTLTVNDGITGYINLATLKSVVAESSSFSDFQTRIAAL